MSVFNPNAQCFRWRRFDDGAAQESPGILLTSSALGHLIFPLFVFCGLSAPEAGENTISKHLVSHFDETDIKVAAFSQRGLRGEVTLSQEGNAVKVLTLSLIRRILE